MARKKLSIAVVGSGVAGLTAAYLLNRDYNVTVFEKNDYPGGHTHTIVINRGPDSGSCVDTGFIVMNHRNYPLFTRLLDRLGVLLRDSDMSFGYSCLQTGIQYSSCGVSGLYAQRSNFAKPSFQRMVFDLFRFYRHAKKDLERGSAAHATLGEYLRDRNFSEMFIRHHILPMGAAIWSTPDREMMDFPADSFFRFFSNHGLLSVSGQPVWKTVVGGSHTYVRAIRKTLDRDVITGRPVKSISRKKGSIRIRVAGRKEESFDRVIIAAHADEALALLADPTPDEKRLLGAWRYQKNRTVLHTDDSFMPENVRARASWNFLREHGGDGSPLSLTYHMNRLQGLRTASQYYVTLNSARTIPGDRIIAEMDYHHPTFTFQSMNTQSELPNLNGVNNTYFCGSYFGYGFHEDAVRSAVEVAKRMGCDL
jgi:predicted NAD/FAD-binding protein